MCPQRMTDKCFRKCIGKPGGSLDNSEQVRRPGDPGGARGAGSRAAGSGGLGACAPWRREASARAPECGSGLPRMRRRGPWGGARARATLTQPGAPSSPCRNASPCAWTATWTPGTPCPAPTTLGCSGNEPTCDRGRGTPGACPRAELFAARPRRPHRLAAGGSGGPASPAAAVPSSVSGETEDSWSAGIWLPPPEL